MLVTGSSQLDRRLYPLWIILLAGLKLIWTTSYYYISTKEHGFALHKGAFRDALSLRYNWQLANLPNKCIWSFLLCWAHSQLLHWRLPDHQT